MGPRALPKPKLFLASFKINLFIKKMRKNKVYYKFPTNYYEKFNLQAH